MMRQDMAYYDDHRNSTGALCVRLSTDASKVQGATGIRLGSVCQSVLGMGQLRTLFQCCILSWSFVVVVVVAVLVDSFHLRKHRE